MSILAFLPYGFVYLWIPSWTAILASYNTVIRVCMPVLCTEKNWFSNFQTVPTKKLCLQLQQQQQQGTDFFSQSPIPKHSVESSTQFSDFPCAARVLKLRLETLRWSARTNEFPLSARTCGIFPICWADCNESEPKRSQEARAEKIGTRGHERGSTEIDFSWSKSVLCTDLCRCRFCARRVLCVCLCVCVLETKGEQISSSYMQVGRGSFREALNISGSWWRAWKCLKRRLIPRVKSP